jgi:hypothetical protein
VYRLYQPALTYEYQRTVGAEIGRSKSDSYKRQSSICVAVGGWEAVRQIQTGMNASLTVKQRVNEFPVGGIIGIL